MSVPTPHNNAKLGDIAKKVLMPGDPLRAKVLADTYLDDVVCFNTVRNMLGYTGTYKGERVSVMGSGMGMPSIGLYTYELYHFYDVDKIIRIGSCGALQDNMHLGDIVIAMGACTDSNYAAQYRLPGTFAPIASFNLLRKAVEIAESKGYTYHVGNAVSSDVFYSANPKAHEQWRDMGALCAEMESAALYCNAAYAKKEALGIFTVSDHCFRPEEMSAEDRQTKFTEMMEVALGI